MARKFRERSRSSGRRKAQEPRRGRRPSSSSEQHTTSSEEVSDVSLSTHHGQVLNPSSLSRSTKNSYTSTSTPSFQPGFILPHHEPSRILSSSPHSESSKKGSSLLSSSTTALARPSPASRWLSQSAELGSQTQYGQKRVPQTDAVPQSTGFLPELKIRPERNCKGPTAAQWVPSLVSPFPSARGNQRDEHARNLWASSFRAELHGQIQDHHGHGVQNLVNHLEGGFEVRKRAEQLGLQTDLEAFAAWGMTNHGQEITTSQSEAAPAISFIDFLGVGVVKENSSSSPVCWLPADFTSWPCQGVLLQWCEISTNPILCYSLKFKPNLSFREVDNKAGGREIVHPFRIPLQSRGSGIRQPTHRLATFFNVHVEVI